MSRGCTSGGQYSGVALFACLALLLILSIAGTSAVRTTTLEARMVRNAEDALIAFQAAEAALGEGESFVSGAGGVSAPFAGTAGVFSETGSNGLWTVSPLGRAERWASADTWAPNSSRSRLATTRLESVAQQPRYIIEWLATLGGAGTEGPFRNPTNEEIDENNSLEDGSLHGESAEGESSPREDADDESPPQTRERLEIFRVTAWGAGRTEFAQSMVQSTYGILIRDTGDCSHQPGHPNGGMGPDARPVMSLDATTCHSAMVAAPSGMAGTGRLSWREIPPPAR